MEKPGFNQERQYLWNAADRTIFPFYTVIRNSQMFNEYQGVAAGEAASDLYGRADHLQGTPTLATEETKTEGRLQIVESHRSDTLLCHISDIQAFFGHSKGSRYRQYLSR